MNKNMRLLLELVANNSGLNTGLNNSRRDIHAFANSARREFNSIKGMATSLQGRLATLGVGIGAGKIVMDSARLDKSLTQIGQTAGEGGEKVIQLRKELFTMAGESGQNVENLKNGFNVLVQTGLSMKESKATLDGINIAMAVTGASSDVLAKGLSVAAKSFDFDLSKPGEALMLLDQMTVAGRLGNAELEKIADIYARVGQSSKRAGMGFSQSLAFVEALSQVEMDPHRLGTLGDSALRVFTNGRYMREAQHATGVKFFNKDESKRNAFDVIRDIKKKYDLLKTDLQRENLLQAAFGKMDTETIKGMSIMLTGKQFADAQKYSKIIANGSGTLKKDFNEATRNLVDQTGRMGAKLREAADGFVTPINKTLAEFMKFTMADKKDGGMGLTGKDMILGGGALAVGTLLTARYGGQGIASIANKVLKKGGSTAAGVAEGKLLQTTLGVTPVFVVNMPGSIGGGVGHDVTMPPIETGSGIASRAGLAAMAARMGQVGLILAGSYASFKGLNGMINVAGERLSYGKHKGEGAMGALIADMVDTYKNGSSKNSVKNDIKVDISFDDLGRAMIRTRDMNTNASINPIRRGAFFGAMGMPTEGE